MDTLTRNQYSRNNAVNYAVKYALKPNPAYKYFSLTNTGGDCSNFISQCLLAGGAVMNSEWWYRHYGPGTNNDRWSLSWSVANSLYWYLKTNQSKNSPGLKGLEVSNAGMLELGDLIYYQDSNGQIFHSAIVTSFANGNPLVSHHSFEALNIYYFNSWPSAKYHFLKISL